MSDQPTDIGKVLKGVREQKSLTLDMVHEATKIPIDSLKAIEEGYKVRTLTVFYYRSFVRIYAQHLGLDPEPLLMQIPTDAVRKSVNIPHKPKPALRRLEDTPAMDLFTRPLRNKGSRKVVKTVGSLIAIVAALILVVVVIKKIGASLSSSKASASVEKKAAKKDQPASAATLVPVKKIEPKKPEAPKPALEAPKPVASTKPVEAVKPAEPPKPADNKAAPGEVKPAVKSSKKVSVSVRAVNTSWIKVKTDGSEVFSGTFKKGNFESWSANKSIEISGKDIDQLEFEVNGNPVPRLSRRGAPAKKIRITPEGLTVEK